MMERCEKQAGNKESMKQSEYLCSMLFVRCGSIYRKTSS